MIKSATFGNGLAETANYDKRVRLTSYAVGSVYSLTLTYEPDGDIGAANDSVNGNWTYTYDSLNRLATSASTAQSYAYSYDRFGNRWQQTVTAGTGFMSSLSFVGGNNRIDGYSYDAAGNLLNDGVHSYAYDAENRLVSVDGGGTASYFYDAQGRRVEKVATAGTVDYLYDLAGHQVTELTGSSNVWTRGEIYAGNKHVATYNFSTTYFDHSDWLRTERVRTGLTGAIVESCASLPFGDGLSCTSSDSSPMHFTAKNATLNRISTTSARDTTAQHWAGSSRLIGHLLPIPCPMQISVILKH